MWSKSDTNHEMSSKLANSLTRLLVKTERTMPTVVTDSGFGELFQNASEDAVLLLIAFENVIFPPIHDRLALRRINA